MGSCVDCRSQQALLVGPGILCCAGFVAFLVLLSIGPAAPVALDLLLLLFVDFVRGSRCRVSCVGLVGLVWSYDC